MVKEAVLIEAGAPLTHVCRPTANDGVQRNAVSIVAHGLQQAGIIGYNRGHMEIYDPEGLEEPSCECFRVVKAQRDRLLQVTKRRPMVTAR